MLSDYRTGLLSGRQAADLESHVSQCAECARELELMDSVLTLVEANIQECEPPAGLWNGVYNRITDPTPEHGGFGFGVLHWMSRPLHAAGMGFAALALAVGLYVGIPDTKPVKTVVVSASDEYSQGHALYTSQSSLVDRAAYLTLITASSDTSVTR